MPLLIDACVPQSCNTTDFTSLINASLQAQQSYNTQVFCTESKTTPYSAGAIVMIVVCAIFLALAFVGSAVDIGLKALRELMKKPEFSFKSDDTHESEHSPLLERASDRRGKKLFSSRAWENTLAFVTAFSLIKNVPMILSTKQPPHNVKVIGVMTLDKYQCCINCSTKLTTDTEDPDLGHCSKCQMTQCLDSSSNGLMAKLMLASGGTGN